MESTPTLPPGWKMYTWTDDRPAAWAVYYGKQLDSVFPSEAECEKRIEDRYLQTGSKEGFKVCQLFLAPKISDKEREAIEDAAGRLDYSDGITSDTVLSVQLRAIADRLG